MLQSLRKHWQKGWEDDFTLKCTKVKLRAAKRRTTYISFIPCYESKGYLSVAIEDEHTVRFVILFETQIESMNTVEILAIFFAWIWKFITCKHPPSSIIGEIVLNSISMLHYISGLIKLELYYSVNKLSLNSTTLQITNVYISRNNAAIADKLALFLNHLLVLKKMIYSRFLILQNLHNLSDRICCSHWTNFCLSG